MDDRWNGLVLFCLSSGPDIGCLFLIQITVGMHCSNVNVAVCNIGSLLPSSGVFVCVCGFYLFFAFSMCEALYRPLFYLITVESCIEHNTA